MLIEKKLSLREQVYEYLKNEIVNGNIKEEARMIEEEYAIKLNISRTPVREAFRMLELEGFVVKRNKGGVSIPKLTTKDIIEIIQIRKNLEDIIFREVIEKITDKDYFKLEKNLDTVACFINIDSRAEEIYNYVSNFYQIIYSISDLSRVLSLINNLNLYLKKFKLLSANDAKRRLEAHQDHVNILSAIKNKDIDKVLEVNHKHLDDLMDFLLNKFNS